MRNLEILIVGESDTEEERWHLIRNFFSIREHDFEPCSRTRDSFVIRYQKKDIITFRNCDIDNAELEPAAADIIIFYCTSMKQKKIYMNYINAIQDSHSTTLIYQIFEKPDSPFAESDKHLICNSFCNSMQMLILSSMNTMSHSELLKWIIDDFISRTTITIPNSSPIEVKNTTNNELDKLSEMVKNVVPIEQARLLHACSIITAIYEKIKIATDSSVNHSCSINETYRQIIIDYFSQHEYQCEFSSGEFTVSWF
jgi:hypothetical protein